jgi:hypothetical protein
VSVSLFSLSALSFFRNFQCSFFNSVLFGLYVFYFVWSACFLSFFVCFVDIQAPYKSTIFWPLTLHSESHCGINSVLGTGIGVGALRFETTDTSTWVRETLAEMYLVLHTQA